MTIPQHSTKSNEHYTPAHIVGLARSVMGSFDLDPASCPVANETVRASLIFTKENDGLSRIIEWSGKVFLNPPGGRSTIEIKRRYGTGSFSCAWWFALIDAYRNYGVTEFVFIGFTLELLRNAQAIAGAPHPFDFSVCVPRERLRFTGGSPTHANIIVYGGPNKDRFFEEFSSVGICK